MAIFTLIGSAIAGALGLGAAIGSLIGGALAFGAKYLLNNYLNRKKKRSYSAVAGESQIGGAVPISTLYGTGKTSGHRLFYAKYGSGNKFNAEVFRLAHGWCDGLEPYIYMFGKKYDLVVRPIIGNEVAHYGVAGFDNLISIRFYDGRPGQQADAKLVADTAGLGQTWKATSRCTGVAYVVVEREYKEDKFPTGRPDFGFVLRGQRCYDPRKDSTIAGGSGPHRLGDLSTYTFTKNPAVQRLNYQLGLRGRVSGRTLIGEGKSLGQLDLSSYIASMNVADTVRSNGKKTYESNLWVTSDDDHTEILKEFDDAMAGYGLNRRGLSGVLAGAPQVPVLEITADDIPADRASEVQYRKSSFDLYNQLSGQFTSIEKMWEPESLKPIVVNADVAHDKRAHGTSNDFLQVTDADIGQYLLNIRYRQQRKGGKAKLPVSRRVAFQVMEGEWVTYNGRQWLVMGWSLDDRWRASLELAETGADIYAEGGIEPGPIVIGPQPPINPSLLATVQNFNVEVGIQPGGEGEEFPALRFSWTPPADPTITAVRIFYFAGLDPIGQTIYEDVCTTPEAGVYVTSKNVRSLVQYTARATIRTVPDRPFKSFTPWRTTATITGPTQVYPPGLIDKINKNTSEQLAPLNEDLRVVIERESKSAQQTLEQDAGQFQDKVSQLTKLQSVYNTAVAMAASLVLVATGPGSAIVTRLDTYEAKLGDKANVSALQQIGLVATDSNGVITGAGTLLQGVQATVANVSAQGMFRTYVTATESGAASTIGLSASTTSGGATNSAALLLSARSNGESMIGLVARLIYFTDGAGNRQYPFVFENGIMRANFANIGTITAGLIQSPDGKFLINVAAGSLEWWD